MNFYRKSTLWRIEIMDLDSTGIPPIPTGCLTVSLNNTIFSICYIEHRQYCVYTKERMVFFFSIS